MSHILFLSFTGDDDAVLRSKCRPLAFPCSLPSRPGTLAKVSTDHHGLWYALMLSQLLELYLLTSVTFFFSWGLSLYTRGGPSWHWDPDRSSNNQPQMSPALFSLLLCPVTTDPQCVYVCIRLFECFGSYVLLWDLVVLLLPVHLCVLNFLRHTECHAWKWSECLCVLCASLALR